ncbi:hypothetical protein T08_4797 [Trichinella sp. T8]|nr:hypothetical protein T08_4797 [Trichinella sp. T8]
MLQRIPDTAAFTRICHHPSLLLSIILHEINLSIGISKFIFDPGVHRPQFDTKRSILTTLATPELEIMAILRINDISYSMQALHDIVRFWVDFRQTNASLLHTLSMRYNISMKLVFLLQQKSPILAPILSMPPLPRA